MNIKQDNTRCSSLYIKISIYYFCLKYVLDLVFANFFKIVLIP